MDYLDLLKRAWQITIKYKFLWIFGLFLGGSSFGGGVNFNSNLDKYSDKVDRNQITNLFEKSVDFVFGNIIIISLILLVILFLFLLMIFLKIVSEGAIIGAVNMIEKEKEINFSQSFKLGLKYFWKILAIEFIFGVIIFISVILLGIPVALLFMLDMILRGLALLLLALAIFIPLVIILGFTSIYSLRFIVIKEEKVISSIKSGFNLFRKNLGATFIIYLLLLAINLVVTIISIIAILSLAFIIGIPAVIIGIMIYPVAGIIGAILLVIFGILFFMAIALFIGAILNAYKSTLWTLTFKKLIHM